MKKIRYLFLLLAYLLIFISGCDKDTNINPKVNELDEKYSRMAGYWQWLESAGGFGNLTFNPGTTGDSIIIAFDNLRNYIIFVNDTMSEFGTFTLDKPAEPRSDSSLNFYKVMEYSKPIGNSYMEISDHLNYLLFLKDSMYITPVGVDVFSSLFIKKK